MSFTPVVITAQFLKEDTTPQTGAVFATLSETLTNGTQQIEPEATRGVLDASGRLITEAGTAFTLVATDDTGTKPQGATYIWQVLIDGAPIRSFEAPLPHTTSPVDLTVLES